MTSRYRVEYHLKSHRRDELIEWIKGLLVVPFVLVRDQPSVAGIEDSRHQEIAVRDRYASVFADVEGLIADHSLPVPSIRLLTSSHPSTGEYGVQVKIENACPDNWDILYPLASSRGIPYDGTSSCDLPATFRCPEFQWYPLSFWILVE